jgi:hypothetical protein
VNWDNQNNQDPWGRKDQDEVSFDDLIKKFSVMFAGKKVQAQTDLLAEADLIFQLKKLFYMVFLDCLLCMQACRFTSLIPQKEQLS